MNCENCGSGNFDLVDGMQYCSECFQQSQNFKSTIIDTQCDETTFNVTTDQSILIRRIKEKKKFIYNDLSMIQIFTYYLVYIFYNLILNVDDVCIL
ncbi:hypothetical protein A3Q56_05774 [Intoshia linei]|uniref:TATA box-binding protein-associated factor 1B n=1 Tax=Intoshia linei TaxID=1819745 RepID=A0A177AWU5_9BILA|nr:hypothetical protein A3Q56_05774 [Intoshia linei]